MLSAAYCGEDQTTLGTTREDERKLFSIFFLNSFSSSVLICIIVHWSKTVKKKKRKKSCHHLISRKSKDAVSGEMIISRGCVHWGYTSLAYRPFNFQIIA